MTFKVLITEPMLLVDEEIKALQTAANVEVCPSSDHDTIKMMAADADIIQVVYAKITADIIESSKKLRGIVRYGVGVDNVDLQKATELGILVANVPEYATDAVADHTMALLLTLARKVVSANSIVATGNFGNWTSPSVTILGIELRDKVLGLIGLGRIGIAVAQRARSFGMKVMTFDPYISLQQAEQIGVATKSLDDLFKVSDFISLHAPLTNETRDIINESTIAKMKDGVFLINTARGPLIDAKALVAGLKSGKIAGVGLDVFASEPPDPNDGLLGQPNVVMTPHIAYYTRDSIRRLEMAVVRHSLDILQGRTPSTLVNPGVRMRKS